MTKRIPPLAALRSFEATARLGSIGVAADTLNVTHSAISHQIRALEEFLGVILLDRSGRQVALTEEGRVYAYRVRQSLDGLVDATEQIRGRPDDDRLAVSVLPSFAMYWLLPRLSRFTARHPQLQLQLNGSMAFTDFAGDELDCALRFGQGKWPDLQSARLMDDSFVLVASPHFRDGQLPTSLDEILAAPLMHAGENWALWLTAAGRSSDEDRARKPSMLQFSDSTHLIEAARLGHGIALTRRSLADQHLRHGSLVRVSPVEVPHPSAYYLVWPHRLQGARKITQLLAWLQAEAQTYMATLPHLE